MTVKFHVATDSGAHSIFNATVKSKKYKSASLNISQRAAMHNKPDLRYVKSAKFEEYLHKYATYLQAYEKKFEFYITLDVIGQHQLSYDLTLRLIKEYGLHPVPVVHYGAPLALVKKYMDLGDYIAVAGFSTRLGTKRDAWVHSVFQLLSNGKGIPQWKVHGLGLSRIELFDYYPFYSIDASTPFYAAHVGEICIPTRDDPHRPGHLGYRKIPITERRAEGSQRHYLRMSGRQRAVIDDYLGSMGYTFQEAHDSYSIREALNMILFTQVAKDVEERRGDKFGPLRLYTAGAVTEYDVFKDVVKRGTFEQHGVDDVYYLGTFYAKSVVQWFIDNLCSPMRPRLRKVLNESSSKGTVNEPTY